ncbi:chromatin structure-remodeling complex subunit RSC7 [Sporobolomyces koalae]|uniref:chromatin structure-remodeling complex subunit RSC7 n=1 Tax=Sporobolomyces koalae TaxID=500713 RepID=UPI00317CABF3
MNPQQNYRPPPPGPPPPAPAPAPAPAPGSYAPPAVGYPLAMQQHLVDSSSYSRGTSTDPGSMGVLTGDVGTPAGGSEDGTSSGAATPLATEDDGNSVPAPAKRSKALNFLKKKETKINVKGMTYKIVDDEIVLDDDPKGEAKIDENGQLLGGRAWKVHTFTSPMRTNTDKLYMLSIDAARCAGFRDSLYFFRRNPRIHKLSCSQAEKDRLIELGKLSGNLKSRAVTMVSARNVFKVMGATFVQDGKYIVDDYYEAESLAAGHKPGEVAFIEPYDPEKDTGTLAVSKGNAPPGATSLGLNVLIGHPGKTKMPGSELISSQIGGGLHATFGGNGLQPFGKSWDPSAKKAKPASHLTIEDWMYEFAKEVGETNRRYIGIRRSHIGQVAISLGVEEREEDCWEMVEEEYEDPEPVPQTLPAAPQGLPLAPLSYTQPQPRPPFPPSPANTFTGASGTSPQTYQPPNNSSLRVPMHTSPYPHPPNTSASPLPVPPAAPAPRPKKKRMTKRFNPIRGFYELETNVPHVYKSTQPSSVIEMYREDQAAHIFPLPGQDRKRVNGDREDDGEEPDKRRKMELAASTKAGVASLEFVSYETAWNLEEKAGREPLIPGMWDFGAGPQALESV